MTKGEKHRQQITTEAAKAALADRIFERLCSRSMKLRFRTQEGKLAFARFVEDEIVATYWPPIQQPALKVDGGDLS